MERPILFNGDMVRAILEGRKTMTRRVLKPKPAYGCHYKINGDRSAALHLSDAGGDLQYVPPTPRSNDHRLLCPFGSIGGQLWVREKWAVGHAFDGVSPAHIPAAAKENQKEVCLHYAASEDLGGLIRRPSIHMPRWASRITLEITDVRVHRLQEISEEDAVAEGMQKSIGGMWCGSPHKAHGFPRQHNTAVEAFADLWNSIYDTWDANPWVWAVSFKRV